MMNNIMNYETMEDRIIKQQEARIKVMKTKIEFYEEQIEQANTIISKLSKPKVNK